MSENYTNYENLIERNFTFQFEALNPEEESYSMFDDYLL